MTRHWNIANVGVLAILGLSLAAACSSVSTQGGAGDPSQPPAECLAKQSEDAGLGVAPEPVRCVGGETDSAGECPQGYRCNTSLAPPVCQKLYCGTPRSLCSAPELCRQGSECFEGRCTVCDVCGDRCAVDFAHDPENCGACGNVVAKDRTCVDGVPTCKGRTIECDGVCVDPSADAAHCGGCDRPVAAGSECKDGAPVCIAGMLTCSGKCIDPVDEANCTACKKTCPTATECTKLGGGGCLGRHTTSTPSNIDCAFICSLSNVPCVDGSPLSYASYQGSATRKAVTCTTDPPQSIVEGGVTRPIAALSCACLHAPQR